MTEELQHEIACVMAHTNVSRDDVELFYGADLIEAVWPGVVFRRACMQAEIAAVRIFVPSEKMRFETIGHANRRAGFCLAMLHLRAWYPSEIEHLRYLLLRATLAYNDAYGDEIAARLAAKQAADAVDMLLQSRRP